MGSMTSKNLEEAQLKILRKSVRKFLASVQYVSFRAVDCEQESVEKLLKELKDLSGYRGK